MVINDLTNNLLMNLNDLKKIYKVDFINTKLFLNVLFYKVYSLL